METGTSNNELDESDHTCILCVYRVYCTGDRLIESVTRHLHPERQSDVHTEHD